MNNIFDRNQNWGRRWKSESPLICKKFDQFDQFQTNLYNFRPIWTILDKFQNWGRRWKSESPLIWNNGCDFRHHAWTEFKPIYISLQRPHGWLHSSTLCTAQCKFLSNSVRIYVSCKKVLTQNVEILNLDTSIKIIKNFKSSPKIRTEIPKNWHCALLMLP